MVEQLGQLDIYMQKDATITLPHTTYKINSKWIRGPWSVWLSWLGVVPQGRRCPVTSWSGHMPAWLGHLQEATNWWDVSFPLFLPPLLFLSLKKSINKWIKDIRAKTIKLLEESIGVNYSLWLWVRQWFLDMTLNNKQYT